MDEAKAKGMRLFALVLLCVFVAGVMLSCSSAELSSGGYPAEGDPISSEPLESSDPSVSGDGGQGAISLSEKNKDASVENIPSSSLVDVRTLHDAAGNGAFVLDVRPVSKFARASIEGSKNIPAGRMVEIRMDEVPLDEPVYVIDEGGERIAETYFTLLDSGYDAEMLFVVEGGMDAWQAAGYETVAGAIKQC